MNLKETIDLMQSVDYKDRFVAELKQCYIRMDKLDTMLKKYRAGELDFEPTCPIELLEAQLKVMEAYFQILVSRASVEGIEYHLEA